MKIINSREMVIIGECQNAVDVTSVLVESKIDYISEMIDELESYCQDDDNVMKVIKKIREELCLIYDADEEYCMTKAIKDANRIARKRMEKSFTIF